MSTTQNASSTQPSRKTNAEEYELIIPGSILTHPALIEGLISLFSSSAPITEPTGVDRRAGLKQKTVSR
jgi:hypothetical protein